MLLDFDLIELRNCVVLGACGYPFATGHSLDLKFSPEGIGAALKDGPTETIFYPELLDIMIAGPGTVTSGGGFAGGGFGVEAALEGVAMATVLNLLTTRSKIHTYVTLTTHGGELHLHYGSMEPGALRVALAPVYVALRRLDPEWFESRARRLELQRNAGIISELEHDQLKQRLVQPPNRDRLERRIAAYEESLEEKAAQRARAESAAAVPPLEGQIKGRAVDVRWPWKS